MEKTGTRTLLKPCEEVKVQYAQHRAEKILQTIFRTTLIFNVLAV